MVALVLFLVVAVAVASVVDTAARAVGAGRPGPPRGRRAVPAEPCAAAHRARRRRPARPGAGDVRDDRARPCCAPGADGTWTRVAARGDRPPARPGRRRRGHRRLRAGRAAAARPDAAPARPAGARRVRHPPRRGPRPGRAGRAGRRRRTGSSRATGMRTALLAAVSHDLRTPLAGIKAAVVHAAHPDGRGPASDRAELLAAIEDVRRPARRDHREPARPVPAADRRRARRARRRRPGRGRAARRCRGLAEGDRLQLDLPDDLPAVRVDAGLLDRVVANLVDNAAAAHRRRRAGRQRRHGRPGLVSGSSTTVPASRPPTKRALFEPFQRLGDAPAGEGVGLGLAVARGLTEAMGGTLTASDTPGGGLTMTVSLPAVPAPRRCTSWSSRDQRARRRRRPRDPADAGDRPAGPGLRRAAGARRTHRRRRLPRRRARRGAARPRAARPVRGRGARGDPRRGARCP